MDLDIVHRLLEPEDYPGNHHRLPEPGSQLHIFRLDTSYRDDLRLRHFLAVAPTLRVEEKRLKILDWVLPYQLWVHWRESKTGKLCYYCRNPWRE
jgi:hypothetical protein